MRGREEGHHNAMSRLDNDPTGHISLRELAPLARVEFEARWQTLQRLMRDARLDALVVTNPANLRYLTGHAPPLAVTPTRPWHVVMPPENEPIVVVPRIGASDMREGGAFGDLKDWPSPSFAGEEGVREVVEVLRRLPRRCGRIGMEVGAETRIGTTLRDYHALIEAAGGIEVADAGLLLWSARVAKSEGEIERISASCNAAGAAFEQLPNWLVGEPSERDVARRFRIAALAAGADDVPFLAMGSGPGGYESLTRAPGARRIGRGDVIGIDTGARVDGYYCDFNRNVAIGTIALPVREADACLRRAMRAGISALRPGARANDVWRAMAAHLPDPDPTARYGHGVGLDLTEPPSIHIRDETILREGMVIAIEPSLAFTRSNGTRALLVAEEICSVVSDSVRVISPTSMAPLQTMA
jgi:Xaa-Pro aminopeptidase